MTERQQIGIAKGVASGLCFMHNQDPIIIHQDIKPLNILVNIQYYHHNNHCNFIQVNHDLNHTFICDMGIAKLRNASEATTTTVSQNVMGTYPYMAPEMFGKGHRGVAVDVYALGCVYIELFGRKRVWPNLRSGLEVMQKVCGCYGNPPTMPETGHLPATYRNLCVNCCQLDCKKRINTTKVLQFLNNI